MGSRSNRGLIFLGLFLGLVSAVLVVVYLSRAGDDGGGSVASGDATPVVVASQNIEAGTRVTADMLAVKEISPEAVLVGVFTDPADVVDQVTRVPLVAGEQVLPNKVTATGQAIADLENPPLAFVVPEGLRGVSVKVDNIIGASGLIRPGDYVDVILTVKTEGSEGTNGEAIRDQLAVTILQNALVLSIDQDVAVTVAGEEDQPNVGSEDEAANSEAASVTLAVPPIHGEVLTTAEACGENFGGRLALALRGFGDDGTVATRSVWAEDGPTPSCAQLLGLASLQ
ncbi:MAG: Flp pilus assembly protein CpaB [Dehalococcoidia bacterium]